MAKARSPSQPSLLRFQAELRIESVRENSQSDAAMEER